MSRHCYVIGYISPNADGLGYGRVDITWPQPIGDHNDLAEVERFLRQRWADSKLTVLSFSLYHDQQSR